MVSEGQPQGEQTPKIGSKVAACWELLATNSCHERCHHMPKDDTRQRRPLLRES